MTIWKKILLFVPFIGFWFVFDEAIEPRRGRFHTDGEIIMVLIAGARQMCYLITLKIITS